VLRVRDHRRRRSYHVRCLPDGFPAWSAQRTGATEAAYYLVTPTGTGPSHWVVMFDRHGVPVWWYRASPIPFDARLLPNGHLVWSRFFRDIVGLRPAQAYEERTLTGRRVRVMKAVGAPTDIHEWQRLPNGDVLVIAYVPRDHVDLRPYGGPDDATVLDCEVQEITPRGRRLWTWRSKEHIALGEGSARMTIQLRDGRTAYDIVHMNSVDVQGDRVVVSLRHTDAVYEIDKASGKILWKLGGTTTPESLTIVGDPLAGEDFGGQHDARLSPDGRTLTLFDNGTRRDRPPRALRYTIDPVARTATLVQSVTEAVPETFCCGSARLLPGGHWVTSWGDRSLLTEADSSGARIFALRFAGARSTYRAEPVLPGTLPRSALRRGMDAMVAP
jgi:hypothetical protein